MICNKDYDIRDHKYQDDINYVIKMNTRAYRYIFAEKQDFKHAFIALEKILESRFKPIKSINLKYLNLSIERIK